MQSHHFMDNRLGDNGNSEIFYFLGFQNHCRWWWQPRNLKTLAPWKKNYDQPRQQIKKQKYHFVNKDLSSQSYGFSSSHVWIWELNYKESWALKNWWFWTVVLEKTLESPLDFKEIKEDNHKVNQSWIFIGSPGSWWWTGKPGVLQSTGSQRIRHDWATELNWKIESELIV